MIADDDGSAAARQEKMIYHSLLLLRCTHDQAGPHTLCLARRAALDLLAHEGLAQSLHGGHLLPPVKHTLQLLRQMSQPDCNSAILVQI